MSENAAAQHQKPSQLGRVPLMHSPNYHTFPPPVPGLSSGSALVEWYRGLFGALSTLGTLGAGFTLSVVVQSPPRDDTAGVDPGTVTTWAAISSILFVLTVLVSQGCSQLFRFEQATIADGIDRDDPCIRWALAGLSLLMQAQVLGAFLFLELVLTAHSPKVGWAGVALTSVLALIAFALWLGQASGRKPVATAMLFVVNRSKKTSAEISQA